MAYRALRQLTVGDTVKQPGDLIPEAMEWTNVRVWLSEGFIEEVPDVPEEKAPAPKKTTTRKRKTTTRKRTTQTKKE